jgi:hypothetical protein
MWFTGRFSGAAVVLVVEPSQVVGLAAGGTAGAFGAGVFAAGLEAAGLEAVGAGAGAGALSVLPPVPTDGAADVEGAVGEAGAAAGTVALSDGPVAVPMSPWSSLHAVIEKATSATLAAAVIRRVREVRTDMWSCPFRHALRWCVDRMTEACGAIRPGRHTRRHDG